MTHKNRGRLDGVCVAGIRIGTVLFSSVCFATEDIGRYQLYQGHYNHWNENTQAVSEENSLMRVDTATGDVQTFISTEKDGKQNRYWSPAEVNEAAG